jgi:hypothetical protein
VQRQGRGREAEAFIVVNGEPCCPDGAERVPVGVASSGDTLPHGREQVFNSGQERPIRTHVFVVGQRPARFEDAADFREDGGLVGDAAQNEADHNGVHAPSFGRDVLGHSGNDGDRDRRNPGFLLRTVS